MNRSHRETCFLSFGPYIGNTRAVRYVSFIRRNPVMSSPPGYSLRARLIADHTSHPPSPCTRSCLCSRLKLAWLHASLIIDHRPPSLAHPRHPRFTLAPSNISDACTPRQGAAAAAPDASRFRRCSLCNRGEPILSRYLAGSARQIRLFRRW